MQEVLSITEALNLPLPLVERSKEEITKSIKKKVEAIKDVKGYHSLSTRMTGKRFYVEMHVLLDSNMRFEDTHRIASNIEREIKSVVPNAIVTIHTEPLRTHAQSPGGENHDSVWTVVKRIAEGIPGSRGAHNIHLQEVDGKLCVDLHLEVGANMTVKQAHEVSEQAETKIRTAIPNVSEITVHMESASERLSRELTGFNTEMESFIQHVAERFLEVKYIHGIEIRRVGDDFHVVLNCHFEPEIAINRAHEISISIEREIKSAYPRITKIDIHEEPA